MQDEIHFNAVSQLVSKTLEMLKNGMEKILWPVDDKESKQKFGSPN